MNHIEISPRTVGTHIYLAESSFISTLVLECDDHPYTIQVTDANDQALVSLHLTTTMLKDLRDHLSIVIHDRHRKAKIQIRTRSLQAIGNPKETQK